MNWICSVVIGSVLASNLMAQTSQGAKQPAQTRGSAASDEELNMRAYIELLRSDIRKSKSQIVSQVMDFDSSQAATFWPIYQQFETDLSKIGDRTVALVNKYTANYYQMTDTVADQLATELLSVEQQRNELKKQYYQKFKRAMDAITAARFLQVENQLERIVDLQIASELPVIQPSQGDTR